MSTYSNQIVGERAFMLHVGDGLNCSRREGGLAMPGFGLVERPSSFVSRCMRRKPPTLAWDPSSNCSRLMLTYEAGHAPDSIFGFFVVPTPKTSAAVVEDSKVEYMFSQEVDGKWETYPFGMNPQKFREHSSTSNPSATTANMVSAHKQTDL